MVALGAAVGLAVAAGELDRALVGLGARVGEEHAAAPAEQHVEPRGEPGLDVVVVQVRDVQQRARLVGDRVGDRGMRVAERRDREPGEEVEVLACPRCPRARVPSPRTNATGSRAVGLHHVLGVERASSSKRVVGAVVMRSPSCRSPRG